jgi:hypothetical protein
MNHVQANPFPVVLPNGKKVVGELCHCGHFRSEHNDTIAFASTSVILYFIGPHTDTRHSLASVLRINHTSA